MANKPRSSVVQSPVLSDPSPEMHLPVRRLRWPPADVSAEERTTREWLVTNGLGGYATGTISGAITRRYHGLLIAALPAPLGRVMLLNHLAERLRFADGSFEWLSVYRERDRPVQTEGARALIEFRLDGGVPIWRYDVGGIVVERSVLMPYSQNTVHVTYRILEGDERLRLTLRPSLDFRLHDAPVNAHHEHGYTLTARDRRIEIAGAPEFPPLRLAIHASAGAFTVDDQAMQDVRYLLEESRGYDANGSLWSPGYFRADLTAEQPVTMIASCESWEAIAAVDPETARTATRARLTQVVQSAVPEARQNGAAELVIAADQFLIRPATRVQDEARALAGGAQVRTIVAGYHWFTDWGRDTMISLEGLALVTGRHAEARQILTTFAHHERHGLIPNLFPEGEREGLYHTADATLWFFHAIDRYERWSSDLTLVQELLPKLAHIVDCHLQGTDFGIRTTEDGLLTQGADGYQLTWMDAKVDDWVVTPRRGKAVEINALWYNALRLLAGWHARNGAHEPSSVIAGHAERARTAFNARFWNPGTNSLFDVVDGEDGDSALCRPNQIIALALTHPVLDRERWPAVLDTVERRLLTPVGLRSLAPGEPEYRSRYFGDLRARDAAYHQGTVWAWLLGPFVDAWLACHPDDRASVRRMLAPLAKHLDDGCIGSVSEIFDADPPFTPRGCIAQAWSVAELLRASVAVGSTREEDRS
jgi:predicted glycogen debranching enzyme